MARTTTPQADRTEFAKQVWLNYYDNPTETTMGDVAIELGHSRAAVRTAVQSLVQAGLLRAHPTRAGLFEHDYWDDPTTAFEEMFTMKNDETPTSAIGNRATTGSDEFTECRCGCGQPVKGKKAEYLPGHDARHAGQVGRAMVGAPDSERMLLLASLPSEPLRGKARRVYEKALAKRQAQAEREAKRAQRLADRQSKAAPEFVDGTVKKGRWSYPARQFANRTMRNEKRDGSGEWVAADEVAHTFES
jgi:hypothetical protein